MRFQLALFWSITLPPRMVGLEDSCRSAVTQGFRPAAEKGIANRAPMSCRRSVLHRSSACPQRGICLRHKCLEYIFRSTVTEEWRSLARKERHHLDAVAQQRCVTKGSEQF